MNPYNKLVILLISLYWNMIYTESVIESNEWFGIILLDFNEEQIQY